MREVGSHFWRPTRIDIQANSDRASGGFDVEASWMDLFQSYRCAREAESSFKWYRRGKEWNRYGRRVVSMWKKSGIDVEEGSYRYGREVAALPVVSMCKREGLGFLCCQFIGELRRVCRQHIAYVKRLIHRISDSGCVAMPLHACLRRRADTMKVIFTGKRGVNVLAERTDA